MEQPRDIAAEVRQGKVSGVGYVDGQRLLGASGPRDALTKMPCLGKEGMLVWTETVRLNAILGGMSLSLKSFKSGLNCYTAFVGARLRWHVCACAGMPTAGRQVLPRGRLLPSEPDRVAGLVDALQVRRHEAGRHWCAWACGWARCRSHRTFGNYLSFVKTGCMIVKASTTVRGACARTS